MRVIIPIKKDKILEIVMANIDDILMNMREEIFNRLQNNDVSFILLESSYFRNSEKKKNH